MYVPQAHTWRAPKPIPCPYVEPAGFTLAFINGCSALGIQSFISSLDLSPFVRSMSRLSLWSLLLLFPLAKISASDFSNDLRFGAEVFEVGESFDFLLDMRCLNDRRPSAAFPVAFIAR